MIDDLHTIPLKGVEALLYDAGRVVMPIFNDCSLEQAWKPGLLRAVKEQGKRSPNYSLLEVP